MKTYKIYGPPGTGKTQFLIDEVKFKLTGKKYDKNKKLIDTCTTVPPQQIGYASFTKEAVRVATKRCVEYCGVNYDDLNYFRTLHSLGYEARGFNPDTVMQDEDYLAVFEAAGFPYVGGYQYDSSNLDSSREKFNDPGLSLINFAANRMISLQEAIDLRPTEEPFADILAKQKALEEFCKDGKKTFSHMIPTMQKHVVNDSFKEIKYLFIDEAQDLSTTQFEFIKLIAQRANLKELWIAGDDDQAIYPFNGADVHAFRNFKHDHKEVLAQSYRVPRKIHEYLNNIYDKITYRENKKYTYRNGDPGSFNPYFHESDISQYYPLINSSNETFLFAARNNSILDDLRVDLGQNNIDFRYKDHMPIFFEFKEAVCHLKILEKNGRLEGKDFVNVLKRIPVQTKKNPDGIKKYGYQQKIINKMEEGEIIHYSMTDLKACVTEVKDWPQMFKHIGSDDTIRLKEHEKNNTLEKKPNVILDTYHGVKGAEYDHSFVFKRVNQIQQESLGREGSQDCDNEWRAYLVACSRSKHSLNILPDPKGQQYDI